MIHIKDLFIELSHNLLLILALTFIYSLILPKLRILKFGSRSIIIGIIFGVIGIIGMYEPVEVANGINIDSRVIITAISGLMGGALPGLLTGFMIGAVRMWIGGAGAVAGTAAILAGGSTGALFFRYLRKNENIYSTKHLMLLGIVLVIEGIIATMTIPIPMETKIAVLKTVLIPLFVLYPVGTTTLGLLLSAETKRRRKEKELDYLFEYANEAIFIFDPGCKQILQSNENATNLLGYSKEEFLEINVSDIITMSTLKHYENIQKINNRQTVFLEMPFKRKGGTEVPVAMSNRLIVFNDQKAMQCSEYFCTKTGPKSVGKISTKTASAYRTNPLGSY